MILMLLQLLSTVTAVCAIGVLVAAVRVTITVCCLIVGQSCHMKFLRKQEKECERAIHTHTNKVGRIHCPIILKSRRLGKLS